MKKIFRLLLVSFALSACGTKPTVETTPTQKDVYTLNANNVTVEVGGTYQFHLYKNNVLVTRNVMWQVSTDLLDITSDGLLTGIYPTNSSSNAFVRGSIGKNYVDCKVTVTGRDSNIYRCMTSEYQTSAEIENTNHVVYSCKREESGSNWDGTKYKNSYLFTYDSLTEKCKIVTMKIGYYVNGEGYQWEEVYAGYNEFTWGDYENGLFYGIMGDIVHDTNPGRERQVNVIFKNEQLVFNKETYQIGFHSQAEYYEIVKNTYTNYTVTSDDIYEILKVVNECKTFADNEVFKDYNNSHPNDIVKLF
ncbi:MAG: hypothetical protein J5955_03030 [Bacilli bacterium]|nr:hypothetical protein [Bacilli bacterium]